MTETMTYPLRLPRSLKRAVERQSKEDRTSINQFVATAVAEKLSALQMAEFFADRKKRADFKAFDKLMKRSGGSPPRTGMKCRAPRGKRPTAIVILRSILGKYASRKPALSTGLGYDLNALAEEEGLKSPLVKGR